jgi:hypothetical protein
MFQFERFNLLDGYEPIRTAAASWLPILGIELPRLGNAHCAKGLHATESTRTGQTAEDENTRRSRELVLRAMQSHLAEKNVIQQLLPPDPDIGWAYC